MRWAAEHRDEARALGALAREDPIILYYIVLCSNNMLIKD